MDEFPSIKWSLALIAFELGILCLILALNSKTLCAVLERIYLEKRNNELKERLKESSECRN